jgi:ABC-2 type transport system permease protein
MNQFFSYSRLWGFLCKEFQQICRDHTTFALIIGIPIIQILLFGFAINTNPKNLPAALINQDHGPFSQRLIYTLENTNYFHFKYHPDSLQQANTLMTSQNVLFILTIPSDFSRQLVRGEHPSALLEMDGSDPSVIAYAIAAASNVMPHVYDYDLVGPLARLQTKTNAAELKIHVRYNPEGVTHYSIVPGLIGLIITMTLVMVTSMVITRERELGTMESLLTTPLLPIEVIIGKVLPYIIVGYLQAIIIFILAMILFHVPMNGSLFLLLLSILPFILANLFVGVSISTLTKTQLEASQVSTFFFLPSILLSGFAFPFKGMPLWAQYIGDVLPMTHFINITRNIMLKGVGFQSIWSDMWPILLFMMVALFIALKRYQQTLD